jgi:Flp pilus assembly protein CpaB
MLLTFVYVANYRQSVQHAQATVQVYVAARNIAPGTSGADLVNTGAMKVVSVPRHAVVPGAMSSTTEIGSLVVSQPLYAGEQVTLRRFSDLSAEGIVGQIKGNMRAIQIPGDPNQLLVGTLHAGDHVDVVANLQTGTTTNTHADRIVLRDLSVLSAGAAPGVPTTNVSSSVILAVSDTQVQRLFYVLKNADWTLELRPAVNSTDSPDRVDSLTTLLAGSGR